MPKHHSENKEIKKVIFLFPYPVTEWDAKRYGFDLLNQAGFDVKIFNVSCLLDKKKDALDKESLDRNVEKVLSYTDFESAVGLLSDCIFIDCVQGKSGFTWRTRRIFKILKKYNVRYYTVEIGPLPIASRTEKKIRQLHSLFKKVSKLYQLKKVAAVIANRWAEYVAKQGKYQLPYKIFSIYNIELKSYLDKYKIPQEKNIRIHTFDYDRYIKYLDNKKVSVSGGSIKTCVFIDDNLIFHRDFSQKNASSPVTQKMYFASLNKFFDYVEETTKLKIIIAACPRSNYENMPGLFGHREIIKDQTLELIEKSDLVLMHASTAVSMAILFNKPILMLKTSEMINKWFGEHIDNRAHILNTPVVNIDNLDEINALSLSRYDCWEKNYDDYKYHYIQTKNLDTQSMWEIIIDHLNMDIATT